MLSYRSCLIHIAGDRFVGLALTDSANLIASPLEVMERVRRSGEKYKARIAISDAGASYAARRHVAPGADRDTAYATVTRRALQPVPIDVLANEIQQSNARLSEFLRGRR
jgi:hypothetical protein